MVQEKVKVEPFVKLCRAIKRFYSTPHEFCEVYAQDEDGKRCYTNSHVMVTNMDEVDETATGIELKTGQVRHVPYPRLQRIFAKVPETQSVVEIPDELLDMIKPFNARARGKATIEFGSEGIRVYEKDMEMTYREVPVPVDETVRMDLAYFKLFQPRAVLLGGPTDMVEFEGCRNSGAEGMDVYVMPLNPAD